MAFRGRRSLFAAKQMGVFNRYAITNAATNGVSIGRPYRRITNAIISHMA